MFNSDESSYSDIARLRERTKAMLETPGAADPLLIHSQPNSRRMSTDTDAKVTSNLNTRYLLTL